VRIVHGPLRNLLSEVVRDELVPRHVATVVRAPSVPQQEVQPWSTDEAATFLLAISQHQLHGLFAVGVALGLREGELLAVRWQDVDLDEGTIRVRQTVQRLPHVGLVYGPPNSLR
jgi:integrase